MRFLSRFLRTSLLLFISSFLLISSVVSVRAGDASTDLTSPGFKISVDALDPVRPDRQNGGNPGTQPSPTPGESDSDTILKNLLEKIAGLFLFMMPVIAVISTIVAGYFYILSGGDSEKATQAKTIIKWNIVAIIVALFSYVIIKMVASLLGGS